MGTSYAKTLKGSAEGTFDDYKKDQRMWGIEYDVEEVPGARSQLFILGRVIYFELYCKANVKTLCYFNQRPYMRRLIF